MLRMLATGLLFGAKVMGLQFSSERGRMTRYLGKQLIRNELK